MLKENIYNVYSIHIYFHLSSIVVHCCANIMKLVQKNSENIQIHKDWLKNYLNIFGFPIVDRTNISTYLDAYDMTEQIIE